MPDTQNETSPLAKALGRIPSGLFVATTQGPDGPLGFVASFVMQHGFAPPTISVAVGKGRDHLDAMRSSGRFAVSVVDKASSGVMGTFFKPAPEGQTPFDALTTATTANGSTVLTDCLAWLDCKVIGEFETGDHIVVFGEVTEGDLLRDGDSSVHLRKDGLGY
jgi:flavin reductase (DIM6/NTAB) family NADH-FMN oxidoreductase RutF